MKPLNRIGLALLIAAAALMLASLGHADTLQCWPAHTPFRADAGLDPNLLGLILTIGAILFML